MKTECQLINDGAKVWLVKPYYPKNFQKMIEVGVAEYKHLIDTRNVCVWTDEEIVEMVYMIMRDLEEKQ